MFRIFQEELLITIVMISLLAGGVLLRILLAVIYQQMIKEADNMAATKNKLLKQCKTKFAGCYQLNNGVANIPIFVDKFLNRMYLGVFSFETLYHLSSQAVLLSVVTAGIGVCKSIIAGKGLGEILPFYIASFFGLYLFFAVSSAADIKGKRRILKVNLVDYLENHLSVRMQVTEQDLGMLFGKRTVELMPMVGRGRGERSGGRSTEEAFAAMRGADGRITAEVEEAPDSTKVIPAEELDVLLKEFLTV